jgi:hypothetical protein
MLTRNAEHHSYSVRQVLEILPYIFEAEWSPPAKDGVGSKTGDPANSGDWLAHLVDIKSAWLGVEMLIEERQLLCAWADGFCNEADPDLKREATALAQRLVNHLGSDSSPEA